jgi:hypothetical protein
MLFLKPCLPSKSMNLFFLAGETSPWDYDAMLEFSDALLIPDFTNITSGPGVLGDLVLRDGKIFLRGELTNGPTRYINMETGQVFPSIEFEGLRPIIVPKWAIALTGDTKESLVEFGPN